MIGLATRAGKTVAGEFSVEKAVKDNKLYHLVSLKQHILIQNILLRIIKPRLLLFQQKAQTIQKNYLKINASFIRFLYLFMVLRLS